MVSASNLAPKLSELIPQRSQDAGTRLKIFCAVQKGQKPFEFEWYKNDQLISTKYHNHKYQIDSDDDTSHLAITNLDLNDSANYSCTVRNDHGSDLQTTILIVKGLPMFFFDFKTICGALFVIPKRILSIFFIEHNLQSLYLL